MLVEFSVVPIGAGVSVSPQIARVLKIVAESGLPYKANPMGTVLEGESASLDRDRVVSAYFGLKPTA